MNTMDRTTDYNNINRIITDQSGNIYIIGQVGGASLKVAEVPLSAYSDYGTSNSLDIVISSFKADGSHRWSKVIGGRGDDYAYDIKYDGGNGILVTGRVFNPAVDLNPTYQPVHFDMDTTLPQWTYSNPDTLRKQMFLIKYDTLGAFQWLQMPEPDTVTNVNGLLNSSFPIGLEVALNGDIYWLCHLRPGMFGWVNNNIITQAGNYILEYNSQGQVTDVTRLEMNVGRGIDLTSLWGGVTHFARNPVNGNYYIAGTNEAKQYTYLSIGGDTVNSNMYLAAFSPNGQLLWKKESGGADIGSIEDIELDGNGNIYLGGLVRPGTEFGGYTYTSPENSGAPFISSFDASGNHLWSEMAVVDAVSITYDVAVSDTEVAVAGYGSSLYWPNNTDSVKTQPNEGYDAFLARFNKSNGKLISMERTNTPFGGASYGNAIAAGSQNTYYVGGNFSISMFLGQDTLYKVGSQRSFFLTNYECDVPEASMKVSGINATNTLNLTYTGDPADSVQWYLGDGTQAWGDSITHSYATKGKYRVCAMAYFECTEVTVCDSLVAGEIGLGEESFVDLAIYPNPTNSLLYLENLPKHSSVKLYNLNGKLLLQEAFKGENSSLDLSDLPKGVYLLGIESSEGAKIFKKVLKD